MKRSLSLQREQLAELSTAELTGVNGAALPTTPVRNCVVNTIQPFAACTFNCFTHGTTCLNCETS